MFHSEFRNLNEEGANTNSKVLPIFGLEVINYAISALLSVYLLFQILYKLFNNLMTPCSEWSNIVIIILGFIVIAEIWVSHIVCDMFYNKINGLNAIIEAKNKKIEKLEAKAHFI
jgi:hypothetical protein